MANLRNIKVSGRYATALFQLAVEYNILEKVKEDMELVAEVVESSRDLLLAFRSPLIIVPKKVKLLEAIFQGRVSDLTLKFLTLITKKGRIVFLDSISDSFMEMYKIHHNIKTVYVETAIGIDVATKEKIREIMKKNTPYSIELFPIINPNLIGGFRLKYGDTLYDASLKHKLVMLKKEFERNIYERKF